MSSRQIKSSKRDENLSLAEERDAGLADLERIGALYTELQQRESDLRRELENVSLYLSIAIPLLEKRGVRFSEINLPGALQALERSRLLTNGRSVIDEIDRICPKE